jgi:hypothetical protein
MKKILFSLVFTAVMTGCGGGSSGTDSGLTKNLTLYGFDAKGAAYTANLDFRSGSYEYSQFSTGTGRTSNSGSFKITPQNDNSSVYEVYDHGQHLLAMDVDKTALLATTKRPGFATAEPALFATKPLTNFSEITGSYYQTQSGPFWIRLNVAVNGAVSVDCKSFAAIQASGEMSDSYDPCTTISVSNARLEPLSSPYWKLSYEIKYNELAAYGIYTSTVLFAKGATGRVAYFGENSSKFCYGNGVCDVLNDIGSVWQETQNFSSPANYSGGWLFNRQGASSSLINLEASGLGATSSGLSITATFSKELTNIDPTRNALDIASYLNTTSTLSNPLATTNVTVGSMYGRSQLKSLGGNISIERSLVNGSAIFDKVALEAKTFTLPSNGGTGPYVVPFGNDEVSRLAKYDVFIESAQPNSAAATSSMLLTESIDYSFDQMSGTIVLRSSIPIFDSERRALRLTVKAYLAPAGMTANPLAWGVRIR